MPAAKGYQPQAYWEERLSGELGLTTVGHAGLGYAYNSWLYRARYRAVRRALRVVGLDMAGRSVVEIGVGSGAWIPFWQSEGVDRLTGLDITSASVSALRIRYPAFDFAQLDIGQALPSDLVRHLQAGDCVTAFDVLFHIVDDGAFSTAVANLGRLVRPGGWAILTDSFPDDAREPGFHECHRSYRHYLDELGRRGFAPVCISPIFYTMTTTFSGPRALALFTLFTRRVVRKLAARRATEWLNHGIGSALYVLDGVLARSACGRFARGPSLNILILRKDSEHGDACPA